jgi:hypothetical protein
VDDVVIHRLADRVEEARIDKLGDYEVHGRGGHDVAGNGELVNRAAADYSVCLVPVAPCENGYPQSA